MSEKKPNRRDESKARTRATALAAAQAAIEDFGYQEATIRMIAKRMKMSTGAVFANFKSKAALYEAIYGHPPVSTEDGRDLLAALKKMREAVQPFVIDPAVGEAAAAADLVLTHVEDQAGLN